MKSVSCTSNFLARTCDSRMCTRVHLMLILSLQDLRQNQSPEAVPVCVVVLCFPHNNVVWTHMCHECTRPNVLSVCRMLCITWWHNEQVCSQTTKYQVYQCAPGAGMSEQVCEQTFHNSPTDPISSSLNWWSPMHGVATLYNCWVVLFASSQYLSTRFFAWPSKSKDHEEMFAPSFQKQGSFSFAPAEILDSNIFLWFSTISLLVWHSLWVQPE